MKILQILRASVLAIFLTCFFAVSSHAEDGSNNNQGSNNNSNNSSNNNNNNQGSNNDQDSDIPQEGVAQGDFALWLVKAAGAEGNLPPAALQEDAMKYLRDLGIQPKDGWDKDAKLTKKDLIYMLGLEKKEGEAKTWNELVMALVDFLVNLLNQLTAISDNSVPPTISPSGTR